MSQQVMGIIDIETTGFLDKGGLIVEVGIASLDIETGEVSVVYDGLVREEGFERTPKSSRIFHNSSLTYEEVAQAPSLESQRDEIQFMIDAFPLGVTAYNKSFDFGFLRDRGFTIDKELECPMHIATSVCKLPGRYGNFKRPKVEEARDVLIGTPYVEEHRGADDAIHEAQIVYKLHQDGHFSLTCK